MIRTLLLSVISIIISTTAGKSQVYILADADFETNNGPLTFSSNGTNIWQIGIPNKPFFGTAASPPNAIMTDTINSYPANNRSSFILNNTDTNFVPALVHNFTYLTFDHKYQTTQGLDGGSVEVSYDGINWQNFLVDTFWRHHSEFGIGGMLAPLNNNMYDTTDTLFNGEYGFSGASNTWINSAIQWNWYLPVLRPRGILLPDSMFIRFTFYSDGISESLDGWIIDNIRLIGDDPGGIPKTFYQQSAINLYPQPSAGFVNVSIRPEINPVTYSVYDLEGRQIKNGTALSAFSIPVGDLENGIYQLKVLTGKNEMLVKSMMVSR